MTKPKKKLSVNEKITLLSEPTGTWNYYDIMRYLHVSYAVAYQAMKMVEEQYGILPLYVGKSRRRVSIDHVLGVYNTSREKELELLFKIKSLGIQKEVNKK